MLSKKRPNSKAFESIFMTLKMARQINDCHRLEVTEGTDYKGAQENFWVMEMFKVLIYWWSYDCALLKMQQTLN